GGALPRRANPPGSPQARRRGDVAAQAETSREEQVSERSERIGFVGTGIMGAPMARNARKAGFEVTATNRTLSRAQALSQDGIAVVRTPREVAQRSDIVVTMVVDSPDVEAVLFGPDGVAAGAHEGLLAIDMSTISPARTKEFAERAGENAPPFRTLDAPVSGGELGAIEARLSIMIGGDAPDV